MKQITAEEGLALIEKYQHKNLKGLDPNDATSAYKMLMKHHQHFYLFEASTHEPSYYGANRTHLLLDEIIPEIEQLDKQPIYYHFILLAAPDAMFMIDDFEALSDFFEANEQVEKYWVVNDRFDGEPKTISLKIVAIMD